MASSLDLSERLQILENLLETFTREFQQLKQELATEPKSQPAKTAVKEDELRPSAKRNFEADKQQTMLSEDFFCEPSQPTNKSFAVDREATVISEDFFSEEPLESDRHQKGFGSDKETTVVSDSLLYEEFNAPTDWEKLQQEFDGGKATIAFDFPTQPPKPDATLSDRAKSPSQKSMPDPWS